MIGIYKWTSPSGKYYIGQAVNLERRKKSLLQTQKPTLIQVKTVQQIEQEESIVILQNGITKYFSIVKLISLMNQKLNI